MDEITAMLENLDLAGYAEKAIAWIDGTGIIDKIPTYVEKMLDLISKYAPTVIDFIKGLGA